MKKSGDVNFLNTRRGQVTVFVIVAVILVAVAGTALFVTKGTNRPDDSKFFSEANAKPELTTIRNSILGCRDLVVKDSLDIIGIQGGYSTYSKKPAKYLDLGWTFIPYYYYEGKYSLPDRIFMEKEIATEVDSNFKDCIDGLEFESFTIETQASTTKASIKRSEVEVSIDMPIVIKQEEKSMQLEMKDAPVVVNSALFGIIELNQYITMSHKNDSKMICITCLADMAQERNLYVNRFDMTNSSVLYVISENYTSGDIYSFEFLNKYTEQNIVVPSIPVAPRAAAEA